MTHDHYALLWRLANRPAPAKTRVSVEVHNTFVPGPVTVYNTVGELPGLEKPEEFVVVGAHLDSWDLGQGTTDNGTGTCVVLETARILAKSGIHPKRTIRFCLFTGEEQGLYGSKEYVQSHKDELPRRPDVPHSRHRHRPGDRHHHPRLTALKSMFEKRIHGR